VRGYFAIGVESVSKPGNLGNLIRTAHAFGASFVFTIRSGVDLASSKTDTSKSPGSVPYYAFDSVDELLLPRGCSLVGVEYLDEAVELPSFRHPRCAAYVLGQERGVLSSELIARCDHVIKIPTRFCINLSTAGAIVLYDRLLATGKFGDRPVVPGGPVELPPPHVRGAPIWIKKARRRAKKARGEG